MVDEEYHALLKQGVEAWNDWRKNNPTKRPDLPRLGLQTYIHFRSSATICLGLNPKHPEVVDFSKATFSDTRLCGRSLTPIHQRGQYYCVAGLSEVDFTGADLRNVDFTRADLRGAVFINADLSGAKLNEADLRKANLSGALLKRAELLDTDLEKATLSGACIEDWNINSKTNFAGVICEHIYLKGGCPSELPDFVPRHYNFAKGERRPSSGNFALGEFTKLFQKALETVDLIFRNGVDWQVFLTSFQKLQVECGGEEISIQAIENKNDGAFVIRINVPFEANKAEIEKYLKREYESTLKAKDEQILLLYEEMNSKRQENTSLLRIIQTMAEKENSKYYFYQSQISNIVDTAQSGSRQQSINHQHNYAAEQKQNLVEAAREIQALLQQLEQIYPTNTPLEKQVVITEALKQIESNPTLKVRLMAALKAGVIEALKELVDNPLINILVAALEGWKEAE